MYLWNSRVTRITSLLPLSLSLFIRRSKHTKKRRSASKQRNLTATTMDNQLAVRSGSMGGDSASVNSGSGREMEENEDEKIYYGFGVFMGLPLADLKAMKEDFIEQQQSRLVHPVDRQPASNGRAPMLPPPGQPERIASDGYERRMEQDPRLAPSAGGPRHPAANGYHHREEGLQRPYNGGGADQCYYERNGDDRDGSDSSDEGHLAAKSHSINYILH